MESAFGFIRKHKLLSESPSQFKHFSFYEVPSQLVNPITLTLLLAETAFALHSPKENYACKVLKHFKINRHVCEAFLVNEV